MAGAFPPAVVFHGAAIVSGHMIVYGGSMQNQNVEVGVSYAIEIEME